MKTSRRTFLKASGSALVAAAYPVGGAAAEPAKKAPVTPFRLEALTDFVDDAIATSFTEKRVEAMMARLKDMGVTRVSWGYYGDARGGYLMPSDLSAGWRRYADAFDALGNPLRVAVEAAHKCGLELYAYYKPYETGVAAVLAEGSPEAREYGRVGQKGGRLIWLNRFVADNPHLRIRHRPDHRLKDSSGVAIAALKLVKRDASPSRLTRDHLQIWSSDLNYRYRKLDVNFTVHEAVEPSTRAVRDSNGTLVTKPGDPVRTFTLSGFELADPYILVTTDFTEGPGDFENTATDMLRPLDAQGREIPGVFATGAGLWEHQRVNFRTWGLMFDTGFGRNLTRLDAPNASGHDGLIAFTRGRNEYLPGALCETEPRVRGYWLSCVKDMLDAGVDGVDFRIENHSTHTDYCDEYGFNDAVLAVCASRGKSDDDAVAQVRGEAYTHFLRAAKALVAARGKRMRINLNFDWFRPDPPATRRLAYPANIHFDWPRWVDNGLMDEAILRFFELPFDSIFSDPIPQEMLKRCEQKGIPVVLNRYVNDHYPDEFQRIRRDGRFSGFILYETASFLSYQGDACNLKKGVVTEVCKLMKNEA